MVSRHVGDMRDFRELILDIAFCALREDVLLEIKSMGVELNEED